MKKTLSVDLRERIVAAYDTKEGTREEVAKRFKVSVGMVKKLLWQRKVFRDRSKNISFFVTLRGKKSG